MGSGAAGLPRGPIARAMVVAFGPSALLIALSLGAMVAVVRGLVTGAGSRWSPIRKLVVGLLAAFPWVYLGWLRPWHRRWGASLVEQTAPLPGDDLTPDPGYQHTRAVTIHAPAEHVWKWLVQIGQNRGGLYSYDWLENLAGCDIHSASRVHSEWQHPSPGDTLGIVRGWGPRILAIDPGHSLVIEGWGAYVLQPIDENTSRLIARARHPRGWAAVYYALLVEIPHYIMERKMLLGLRDRAERSATLTALDDVLPDFEYVGSVAVDIKATPSEIFKAVREVTLSEMPLARLLGSMRYLPGRITNRMPAGPSESSQPLFDVAARPVLAVTQDREVVIGCIGKLHDLVDQQFVDIRDADEFRRFNDPSYEKHAESFRIAGGSVGRG